MTDDEEDVAVDEEHGDQWQQEAAEEVEVDHVGHVHHTGEDTVAER